MVVAGDRLGRVQQVRAAAGQHARAQHGVGLDDLELLVGQLAGLEQDRVRDRDLADVVQRRGAVDQRHLAVGQAQPAREPGGERADALGVLVACCRRGSRRPARAVAGARAGPPRRRARRVSAWAGERRLELGLARRSARCSTSARSRAAAIAPSSSSAAVSGEADHRRPGVEPERVQPRAQRRLGAVDGEHRRGRRRRRPRGRRPRRRRRARSRRRRARRAGRAPACTAARSPPATSSLRPASASASSILVRIMADATDDRRIGTVIAGYRIESRIGRGGMGVVYRAQHLNLERQAALKVIAPDLAESSGFRERFAREARDRRRARAPEHRHRLRRGRGRRDAVPGDAVRRGLRPRARC